MFPLTPNLSPLGKSLVRSSILFYDTFVAPDGTFLDAHTPNIDVVGGGWINADTSRFSIFSNVASTSILDTGRSWALANVGNAQVKVTCTIKFVGASSEGIIIRANNVNNLWMGQQSTNLVAILERTSGTFFVRASSVVTTTPGDFYSHDLSAIGNDITLVHSLATMTYNSAVRNTSTWVGIRGSTTPVGTESFDNFMVVKI